jgi:hypothetical protein
MEGRRTPVQPGDYAWSSIVILCAIYYFVVFNYYFFGLKSRDAEFMQ